MSKAFAQWSDARAFAQHSANETGRDHGIEYNSIFREYVVKSLPSVRFRYGHELTCEVVFSEKPQEGHGAEASARR